MKTVELNFHELELSYKLIFGGEQEMPTGEVLKYNGLIRENITLGVRHRLIKVLNVIGKALNEYYLERDKITKEIWGENPPSLTTKEDMQAYHETEDGKAIIAATNPLFAQKKKIEFEPLHFSRIENEKFNTDYTFLVDNFFDDTK